MTESLTVLKSPKQHIQHLICLPYAGAVSNIFSDWPKRLLGTEVCAVQYPFLMDSIKKSVDYQLYFDELVLNCRNHIKRKFAIFGHSMGAILAYALAKSLEAYELVPECVIVSGSFSPFLVNEDETKMHLWSDEELIKFLKKQNSTIDNKMFKSDMFQEIYLPKLRSDIKIMGECVVELQKRCMTKYISCDIYALGSQEDEDTTQELLNTWSNLTTKSFYTKIFPGDHFYIHQYSKLLLSEINAILSKTR